MAAPEARARRAWYPALFAIYPALFLFAHNIEETSFGSLVLPLALTAAVAAPAWLVARLAVKDRGKAALLAFIALFTIFSYGHAMNLLSRIPGFTARVPAAASIAVWIGAAALLGAFVVRARGSFPGLTSFLNLFVAVLVALSLAPVVDFHLRPLLGPRPAKPSAGIKLDTAVARREGGAPDIYYLIFDRYAGESTLRDYYDFDNGEFLGYLKDKGFYVASESRCNYPGTFLSLASSLNMEHLSFLTEKGPVKKGVINRMLQDYEVWRLLKSAGYRFIHFGDWYEPTKYNRNADLNFRSGGMFDVSRDFTRKFLETTLAGPLVRDSFVSSSTRERLLEKLSRLAEIPGTPGPKFVFAHVLLPHHPFLFGPNGENLLKRPAPSRPQELSYIDQLRFTNAKIRELVDAILARSERDPIIILQSDEGPGEEEKPLGLIRRTPRIDRNALNFRIRCRILNAYRFPGVEPEAFYPKISPVNSFRLLFNRYFGTRYELLPDITYRPIGNKTTIQDFKAVTARTWTRPLKAPRE